MQPPRPLAPFATMPSPMVSPRGAAPAPPSPAPYSLTGAKDDTALLKDARAGFSHLLPGRPVLGTPITSSGEPPADAVVHLQDAPITLRYVLAPCAFAAPDAREAARMTAQSYADWRARAPVQVDFANPSWLTAWGAEAASVAAYDVAGGSLREDLFVLARQGLIMTITWTYPRGLVDDPAYASFASVAEATMIWDGSRWDQRGRVWPASEFWGSGLFARPKPKHNDAVRQVAATFVSADERAHLLAILTSIVSGAGAPWVLLTPDVIDRYRGAMLGATKHPLVRAFLERAFADVVTAHDLRGLAVMLGRALDGAVAGVTSSFPPPPPMPAVRTGRA